MDSLLLNRCQGGARGDYHSGAADERKWHAFVNRVIDYLEALIGCDVTQVSTKANYIDNRSFSHFSENGLREF
jgi:hypothetical protein